MRTPSLAVALLIFAAVPLLNAHAAGDGAQPPAAPAPRVLVLLAEGFNFQEYSIPVEAFKKAGLTVTVAGVEKGTVPLNREKPNPQKDATATLTLDEAKVEDFDGLFIPGGYSPGHLEKIPRALEIAKAFMAAGKPVGAICHGPRLLLKAGLLKDKTFTCLHTVPDELADLWKEKPYRAWLDTAVVVDGNLVTARYPNDSAALATSYMELLTKKESALPEPQQQWVKRAETAKAPLASDAVPADGYGAALALALGFDEVVAAAMIEGLRTRGRTVIVVGPARGEISGLNGGKATVSAAYSEEVKLAPGAVIVAPGGLWPRHNPTARQASQPEWVAALEPARLERLAWLRARHTAGAVLVVCGLDALQIGSDPAHAKQKFSAPDSTRWSFPKGTASFTEVPAQLSTERLVTSKGAAAIDETLKVLDETLAKGKEPQK